VPFETIPPTIAFIMLLLVMMAFLHHTINAAAGLFGFTEIAAGTL
jgi:hypothetical protein